jgi:hypothetical protein
MTHEDSLPQEKTMMQPQPRIITRAEGFITIDIPPVKLPTPITTARWLIKSPAVRTLFILAVGIGIGTFWQSGIPLPTIRPVPVITVTETLEEFVAREAAALSADEREKLIAVTRSILSGHFDTSSEIREEFRYQRLKAGIDSPAFDTFSANWAEKMADSRRQTTAEDSVDFMREIYRGLRAGLLTPNSYLLTPSISGEPVEGFLHNFSPSNVTSGARSEDVAVSPGKGVRSQELEVRREESGDRSQWRLRRRTF